MVWLNLPPVLGIGIPTALIASIGYGGHLFIFHKYLSLNQQLWFQFCLTCVWISYLSAIYKEPGSPPKDFKPVKGQWKRYCKKCQLYKPERAHHCKTCKKCVLKMDHHCPWVANCVGHENMPHFLRFLLVVDYTNGYAFIQLCKRVKMLWQDRNLPIYLISKVELTMVIILTPLSLLVLVSVGTMTLRWFYQILFTGMTQIESWEYERIESQIGTTRFWNIIQKNYKSIYGKDLKSVSSWSSSHRMVRDLNDDDSNPFFTIDDLVFPYDINPWANLLDAFGSPWNWLFFWGKPVGDGLYFRKNEFADDTGEDELNSLPWPPDAGHDEITIGGFNSDDSHVPLNDEKSGTRTARNRTDWFNSYGERLSDFGVDTENEEVTINRDQGLSSGVDST